MYKKDCEALAFELLREFKFKQSASGFKYLVTAVTLCLSSNDYLDSFCKKTYEEIAKQYGGSKSANAIERSIRHLIKEGFSRGVDPKLQDAVFGYTFTEGYPTTKEFVSCCVSHLKFYADKLYG